MTFDDYQDSARRTVHPALAGRDRLLDHGAGLAEEAGEVLAHIRKHAFQDAPLDRARLAEELGDVLWCLAGVADAIGISLGSVAADNLAKIARRHPTRAGPAGEPAPR